MRSFRHSIADPSKAQDVDEGSMLSAAQPSLYDNTSVSWRNFGFFPKHHEQERPLLLPIRSTHHRRQSFKGIRSVSLDTDELSLCPIYTGYAGGKRGWFGETSKF